MPHGVLAGAERRPDTRGVLAGRRARLWGRDTGGAPLLGAPKQRCRRGSAPLARLSPTSVGGSQDGYGVMGEMTQGGPSLGGVPKSVGSGRCKATAEGDRPALWARQARDGAETAVWPRATTMGAQATGRVE